MIREDKPERRTAPKGGRQKIRVPLSHTPIIQNPSKFFEDQTYLGGLDPGLKGALALIRLKPHFEIAHIAKWDATRKAGRAKSAATFLIHQAIHGITLDFANILIACENVNAMPEQGLSSTHGFGLGRGGAEGVLLERGAVLRHVTPAKWKRHLGLSADKREGLRRTSLLLNQRLRAKDHDIADAVQLAIWLMWDLAHAQAFPSTHGKFGILS
jgi:Holliday junction resolvasome RuvABC endonuclease subunit